MTGFCSVYGCNNRFPSNTDLRRQWESAVRREGFVATDSSQLCSEHFKPEDFNRTGQIVRLRVCVLFCFLLRCLLFI
uniref:THAP domain-containing protein 1 n=1 Tax=Kryptolebias marmoratus TaxID=37003 RepID=A0A3Q2ZSC8_KRYMA